MRSFFVILSSAVLALSSCCHVPVVNTFGPGNTYEPIGGYNVEGTPHHLAEVAAPFTAAASGNLATVELGLTFNVSPNGQGPADVYLMAMPVAYQIMPPKCSSPSGTPMAAKETTNNNLVRFAVAGTIPVTKGTNYWLVLKAHGSSVIDLWMMTSVNGAIASSYDDSKWHTAPLSTPAFRLTSGRCCQ